jgi:hypothetical protein
MTDGFQAKLGWNTTNCSLKSKAKSAVKTWIVALSVELKPEQALQYIYC